MRRSLLRRRFNSARIASLWFAIEEEKQTRWSDFASAVRINHRGGILRRAVAPSKIMSIVTKTGDHGSTGLMYNRRVAKCDPRVEAYGSLDAATNDQERGAVPPLAVNCIFVVSPGLSTS